MKPFYEDEYVQIWHGDCREVIKTLADSSVDSVVCDPPYELGFMGKGWDRSGIAYDVSVWSECLRVLKPGGHLLAFGGSRTYHRLACAIEDAGFEIRDQIQWLYGSGFPKSLDVSKAIDAVAGAERGFVGYKIEADGRSMAQESNLPRICNPIDKSDRKFGVDSRTIQERKVITAPATDEAKQWNGWGTALKPAHEPIVLTRKPVIGTVAENILQHGTGGLNIDGCRVGTEVESWPVSRSYAAGQMQPGHVGDTQPTGDAPNGRWPANIIHDGSDEVLALFPDTESGNGNRRPNGGGDFFKGINAQIAKFDGDSGNAARFFYCAKASQEDRNEGLEDLPMQSAGAVTDRKDGSAGLNSPRAGAGRNNGSRNPHPTVKPTDLMRYLCRLVTPPGGTVLDPFCGSGSTGKAAVLEGLRFIGVELSAEYCELARRRIKVQYNRMTLYHLIEAKEQQGALLDG